MTVEVLWSPKAEEDLIDIHAFIALDNEEAADHVIEKIAAAADLLSHHPRLGRRRPEIDPSVAEGPYLILYETLPDTDTGSDKHHHHGSSHRWPTRSVVSLLGQGDLTTRTLYPARCTL